MIHRAIVSGWEIPEDLKGEIIQRNAELTRSPDDRIAIAASKNLVAIGALHLKHEQVIQQQIEAEHARKLQLIELAVRSGLVVNDDAATRAMDCITSPGE